MATVTPNSTRPASNNSEASPMALVVEDTSSVPSSTNEDERKGKSGRHSRFTAEQDLVLVREVATSKAHVAPYGQTRSLFEQAAEKCSANSVMSAILSWKQVQDRYTRLQATFDKEDTITHLRSGIGGGQLSEMNELLSQMKEARGDMRSKKHADKEKVAREEADKERIGQELVGASIDRKRKLSPNYKSSGSSDGESDGERRSGGKRKRRKQRNNGMQGELAAFGEHLKESDLARVALEIEQLAFRRESLVVDREERQRDHEERKQEREANSRLELEKLKIMMEAFSKKRD